MWPGFDFRTRCHMWVEFVVGSRPCSEGFSMGSPVFLPPQKSTLLNSISIGNSGRRATLWKCHWKFPFIFFYICVFWFPRPSVQTGRTLCPIPGRIGIERVRGWSQKLFTIKNCKVTRIKDLNTGLPFFKSSSLNTPLRNLLFTPSQDGILCGIATSLQLSTGQPYLSGSIPRDQLRFVG